MITGNSERIYREFESLSSLEIHRELGDGPDFDSKDQRKTARNYYRPAIVRYDDVFYQTFGDASEREELIRSSKHHMLIVSGLYGLLTPRESIQSYDLNVPDHPSIRRQWKDDELLTWILIEYIKMHKITTVFELLADPAYIRLFDWELLRRELSQVKVLHWECETTRRAPQLYFFGLLAKQLLERPSHELAQFGHNHHEMVGTSRERVYLLQHFIPLPARLNANRLDMVGRMRGNIISLLRTEYGSYTGSGKFGEYVATSLRAMGLSSEIINLTHQILETRNNAEYWGHRKHHGRMISPESWEEVTSRYASLKAAVSVKFGYDMDEVFEPVDFDVPER